MLRANSLSSNKVGVQEPLDFFTASCIYKAVSVKIVYGTPNRSMASRSTFTAFADAASVSSAAPVTYRKASSKLSFHAWVFHDMQVGAPHGVRVEALVY